MTRRRWIAALALAAAVLVYVAIPSHEIWLGVPEELRGAVVYVGDKQVAVISRPDLTLIRSWRAVHELRIEKSGYQPIVLRVGVGGKSYLVVERSALRHAWLNVRSARRTA